MLQKHANIFTDHRFFMDFVSFWIIKKHTLTAG